MTSTSIQSDLLVIRRSQTSENAGVIGQVPNPQPAIDAAMPTMQNAIAAVASQPVQ
jgi:hypothetical protein